MTKAKDPYMPAPNTCPSDHSDVNNKIQMLSVIVSLEK